MRKNFGAKEEKEKGRGHMKLEGESVKNREGIGRVRMWVDLIHTYLNTKLFFKRRKIKRME